MTINEKKQLSTYIKGLVRESLNEMPLPSGFFQGAEDLPEPKSFDARSPYAKFGGSMPKMLKIYKDQHPEGVIAINPDDPSDKVFIPADAIKIWEEDYVAVSREDFDKYFGGEDEEEGPVTDDYDEFWYEHDHPESRRSHYEGLDVAGTDDVDYEESDELNELRRITESMARNAVKGFLMEKKAKKSKKTRKSDGKKKGSKKSGSSEKSIMDRLNSDSINAAHYFYKLYNARTQSEKDAARSLGYKKAKGKKMPGKKGVYHFNSKERNKLNAMLSTDKN